ncbi:MAG: prepilin-type N-terminal cleavage/methylation domain-containing protein [Fimbriimonadales bacterium]|nr:prepilin-type N-terminal cleavage/methylation domain-containing protein [Fimbriimonadales bacterium]
MRARLAFTLIELLVVIAIIAILAAILFPVMSRAKDAAKSASGMSNVRQLSQAMILYAESYDDHFCLAAYAEGTSFKLWHDLLDPYVQNKQIWLNPGSQVSPRDQSGAPTSHWGYNAGYLTTMLPDFSNFASHRAANHSEIREPSETVLFTGSKAAIPTSWCGDDGKFLLPPSWPNADCWGRPDPVHNGMAIIAWIDTHAKRMPLGQFYQNQEPPDRFFDRE